MRSVSVYRNGELAGILSEINHDKYIFRYDDRYYFDPQKAPISLTLPKTQQEHYAETLFPFFSNMLSEGVNRKVQSMYLKIDEKDDFGFLSLVAQFETIGAISVKPI